MQLSIFGFSRGNTRWRQDINYSELLGIQNRKWSMVVNWLLSGSHCDEYESKSVRL